MKNSKKEEMLFLKISLAGTSMQRLMTKTEFSFGVSSMINMPSKVFALKSLRE
jgi:hypothetical protein